MTRSDRDSQHPHQRIWIAASAGLVAMGGIAMAVYSTVESHQFSPTAPAMILGYVLVALGILCMVGGVKGWRFPGAKLGGNYAEERLFRRSYAVANRISRCSPNPADRLPHTPPTGAGLRVDLADAIVQSRTRRWHWRTAIRLRFTRRTHRRLQRVLRDLPAHGVSIRGYEEFLYRVPTEEEMEYLPSNLVRLASKLPVGRELAARQFDSA